MIYDEMVRVLASIHSVDVERAGLNDFGKHGQLSPLSLSLTLTLSHSHTHVKLRAHTFAHTHSHGTITHILDAHTHIRTHYNIVSLPAHTNRK